MILTLFFACILPGKDLVGDSDRPFSPSIENFEMNGQPETQLDSGVGLNVENLSAYVDGDDVYVEHYEVHLPCDFDVSEASISVDEDEFYIEVIYSEREPDDCYEYLSYTLDFEGASSGTYTLEAHGDSTSFDF